jgi:hypothetical protein
MTEQIDDHEWTAWLQAHPRQRHDSAADGHVYELLDFIRAHCTLDRLVEALIGRFSTEIPIKIVRADAAEAAIEKLREEGRQVHAEPVEYSSYAVRLVETLRKPNLRELAECGAVDCGWLVLALEDACRSGLRSDDPARGLREGRTVFVHCLLTGTAPPRSAPLVSVQAPTPASSEDVASAPRGKLAGLGRSRKRKSGTLSAVAS